MVNKEMMSEYLDHKNNCMPYHSTIIAHNKKCRKKCLSSHNCHFVELYFFNIKLLHVNVQCACIVKAKYLIALSKAVLAVDLLVYAVS